MPGKVVDVSVAVSRGVVRVAASAGCCRAPLAVSCAEKPEGRAGEVGGSYDRCLMLNSFRRFLSRAILVRSPEMTIGSKVSQQFVMKEEELGVVIWHKAVRAPFEVN